MKLHQYIFLTAIIFCGCNGPVKKEKPIPATDNEQVISVHNKDIGNKLLGIWTDGGSTNASFVIKKDSIFYVDQFTSYKYELNGDSIKIKYPEMIYTGKIRLLKDSLFLESDGETIKYWKFKK
jgi:hypothetical protein